MSHVIGTGHPRSRICCDNASPQICSRSLVILKLPSAHPCTYHVFRSLIINHKAMCKPLSPTLPSRLLASKTFRDLIRVRKTDQSSLPLHFAIKALADQILVNLETNVITSLLALLFFHSLGEELRSGRLDLEAIPIRRTCPIFQRHFHQAKLIASATHWCYNKHRCWSRKRLRYGCCSSCGFVTGLSFGRRAMMVVKHARFALSWRHKCGVQRALLHIFT